MEVYLIRHTQVAVGQQVCYGQTDIDVASSFKAEAAAYDLALPRDFDAVYSSSLSRCTRLATYLDRGEVIPTDQIKELNFGAWEGLRWDEINPLALQDWMGNFVDIKPPQGENLSEMYLRVASFLDELRAKGDQKVLVVAHAGVIRCFWAYILGIELHQVFKIPVGFGEVFIADLGKERAMDYIQQTQ